MDLFVINRHQDNDDSTSLADREYKNLQKLKQRIEARKRALAKDAVLKPQKTIIHLKETTNEPVSENKSNDPENTEKKETITEDGIDNLESKPNTAKQEFKVLGVQEFEKKVKVKRVLPHWLANPQSLTSSLQNLTKLVKDQDWLHPTLRKILSNENITHLFPVQEQVIPYVIDSHNKSELFWPNDVCVSAPTGSGKTLSFVLPIVQVLINAVGREVRALIVLPVQELATQVAKVFKKYTMHTGLKVLLLSGSVPLKQEQMQMVRETESNGWVSEIDIIVCTAGRLVEHLHNTPGFSLKQLQFLVIDEADRIMDHIQNDWLYHLDRHIKLESEIMVGKVAHLSWNNLIKHKRPPHKMLFSATLSQDPEKLEQWGLFQPKLFSTHSKSEIELDDDEIRKYVTPDELEEEFVVSEAEEKPLILHHLFNDEKWNKVLCFTNASQSAHRLAVLLSNMSEGRLKVAELSAALNRNSRENVLKKFTSGEINVLVSTDALARGIDVPNCDHVISYDPPKNIKTYIHRVGRTGRAGRHGIALTMLTPNQQQMFQDLLKSGGKETITKRDIPDEIYESHFSAYENALGATRAKIQSETDHQVKKSKALKRGFRSTQDAGKHDDGENHQRTFKNKKT